MKTRCPECNTLFNLTDKDLQQADGQVQCGHCFYVFKAEPEDDFELIEESTQQDAFDDLNELPENPDADELDTTDIDLNTFADAIDEIPAESPLNNDSQDPLFTKNPAIEDLVPADIRHHSEQDSNRYLTAIWSLLAVVLLLTAALQAIYFERNRLAAKPELRPYLVSLCELAHCQIEEQRDLKRIELSSKNVYSHPSVENALMITAVIINQAEFAQKFPALQISFTNLVGDIVSARQFKPGEYLNTEEENLSEMQPGLPIQITLEVLDPGSNATAYEFDFI